MLTNGMETLIHLKDLKSYSKEVIKFIPEFIMEDQLIESDLLDVAKNPKCKRNPNQKTPRK